MLSSSKTEYNLIARNNSQNGISCETIAANALGWAAKRVTDVDRLTYDEIDGSGIISRAAAYHLASGGKKFRPLSLLAIAHVAGGNENVSLQTAAACELLHNASLVHDDLQDKDKTRRGRPAVWQVFGPEMAINLGDYFIASAFRILAALDCAHFLRIRLTNLFAETTRKVIDGQSKELSASRTLKLAPDEYENIARLKSGMLLALPVTSALTIAGAPSLVTEHASSTMQWLGIAYQIQDDLVDLFGLKESRQAGVDLREGRVNLPVIYFNQSLINDPSENYFKSWFESENPPSQELEYWIGRVRDSEAVYHSLGHLNAAVAHASAFMDRLPAELRTIIRSVQAKMLKHTDKIIEKSETATVPDGKTNQIG